MMKTKFGKINQKSQLQLQKMIFGKINHEITPAAAEDNI